MKFVDDDDDDDDVLCCAAYGNCAVFTGPGGLWSASFSFFLTMLSCKLAYSLILCQE